MKSLDRLSEYLGAVEKRLRLLALTRGAALTALAALVLTLVAVVAANRFAFSERSVLGARLFLFLGLALAIAAALIVPVVRLNRRHAARKAERRYPQFEERLLTFTEKMEANPRDPFLPLLADDTLTLAQQARPASVARSSWILSFLSAALALVLALIWLGNSGGFLGYGTSLLWAGTSKTGATPFYAIKVDPGNRTIRKRADQVISAQLVGFSAPRVLFFARYASASQWEQAEMRPGDGTSSYQFLIAGVPESLDYYIEAGGIRSSSYKLNVIDLPAVKRVRVTYHYPKWLGIKDVVEDPGGDLRAVQGTIGEVAVETDRPLNNGVLMLDDGSKINLRAGAGGMLIADVPIEKDGMYHVAAIENGEDVRLGEDYFIEAMKDRPPEVKITRPGHDFRASPIEEVTVNVEAKDDFGLRGVELRYSVNGGPEKSIPMMHSEDGKTSTGNTVIALEDFKTVPGDIVSLYAVARDARQSTSTDMFFIEAQPFERNYTQSQEAGGGDAGGDQGNQQDEISRRQKEIITATWNQAKGQGAKGSDAENAAFLSQVQSKLRDQAKSLAERMKARQLEDAGDSFKSFVDDMEKAASEMEPAAGKLKGAKWQEALAPEQRALQALLRAEATFRDIQVAFGRQGGGGGGGGGQNGATRDLEGLFDLELDTEKNQYEGTRQNQSADQRQRQIDEAMQKLQELARRQQELAEQQKRDPQQLSQQRWQQEQLRREAEQLRQQMEQLQQRGQEQLGQQGQQGRQGQSGQQGQQGQAGNQQGGQQGGQMQGGQAGQMQQGGRAGQQSDMERLSQMAQGQNGQQQMPQNPRLQNADSATLQRAIDQLQRSLEDMRNANSQMQSGSQQAQAAQQRAAQGLKDAEQLFAGMKNQQSANQVDDITRQADDLARQQQELEGQMRRAFGNDQNPSRQQQLQLADSRDKEVNQLKKLEQDMQNAARDLQSSQQQASARMREALGNMQQQELIRDMQRNSQWIKQGIGEYGLMSESQITAGLNQLRDDLKKVQQAFGTGQKPQDQQAIQATVEQLQQMRQMLEAARQGMNGQQQGRNGQQGQNGQQQAGQQGGQQSGGQQSGGQQAGGQQSGGQQAGGQPNGGRSGGPTNGSTWGPNGGAWDHGGAWGGSWAGPYWNGQDYGQFYRDTLQNLNRLQTEFKDDQTTQHDIQNVIHDLRQFDPNQVQFLGNDPLLAQRIQAALANVEQVELELRRKIDDVGGGGTVRSPGNQPIPEGYLNAVAEYYRKLSQTKKQ